jgi:threonine aldolase
MEFRAEPLGIARISKKRFTLPSNWVRFVILVRASRYHGASQPGVAYPMIDLRSDTVTKPSPAMRRAMLEAEVGDDVYREDPTVNRLEERAAAIIGKEAALFVPTGTMGNTIAIKLLTEHGQEVIADSRAHLLDYELSMVAWFSGCVIRAIPTERGLLSWDEVRRQIRPLGPYSAPTGAVCIEQTHNMAGGNVYPMATVYEICNGAHERGVRIHMDGARIFNASVALDIPVHEIAAPADTVMFCLSKGLGAPVGSILAGPADLLAKARLYRKRLGGGMRQAGILAAAGMVALDESPAKLVADHANARFLAEGLARIPGVKIDPKKVETNVVVFDVSATGISPTDVSARLKQRGVLMNPINDRCVRAVTHYDVTREQCSQALKATAEVLSAATPDPRPQTPDPAREASRTPGPASEAALKPS